MTLESVTATVARSGYPVLVLDGAAEIHGGECGTANTESGLRVETRAENKVKLYGGTYHLIIAPAGFSYSTLLPEGEGYVFMQRKNGSEGYTEYIDPNTIGTGATGNEVVIRNNQVAKCTHSGGTDDNCKCVWCGLQHAHARGGGLVCKTCGQKLVAYDNSNNWYVSLSEAFEQVADGGTIYAIETLPKGSLTFNQNKSVTLDDLNAHYLESSSADAALIVSDGKLTIAAPQNQDYSPTIINEGGGYAVKVTGGTLEFGGKATLAGGLQVTGGTIEGGLKEGSILTKESGNYSVSVEGCAFAKKDDTSTLVRTDEKMLSEDVIVVEHTQHSFGKDGKCACGFTCTNHNFVDGVCSLCGVACAHPNVSGDICSDCKQQMVVQVRSGSSTTYYAKKTDAQGLENTLQTLLNDDTITPGGSKIILLANDLNAVATVIGRSITLDLNGKKLKENPEAAGEDRGIVVGPGGTLTVSGSGSSESGGSNSYVFKVQLGMLVLDSSFGGTFNGILVKSGTLTSNSENEISIGTLEIADSNAEISFKSGTFGEIKMGDKASGSVQLGSLLAANSGKAFQYATGDKAFVPYSTEITSAKAMENVKIVPSPMTALRITPAATAAWKTLLPF